LEIDDDLGRKGGEGSSGIGPFSSFSPNGVAPRAARAESVVFSVSGERIASCNAIGRRIIKSNAVNEVTISTLKRV
jgi:hypothetical protein